MASPTPLCPERRAFLVGFLQRKRLPVVSWIAKWGRAGAWLQRAGGGRDVLRPGPSPAIPSALSVVQMPQLSFSGLRDTVWPAAGRDLPLLGPRVCFLGSAPRTPLRHLAPSPKLLRGALAALILCVFVGSRAFVFLGFGFLGVVAGVGMHTVGGGVGIDMGGGRNAHSGGRNAHREG